MSKAHIQSQTPMSLMIDVFVELERLQQSLTVLRDELVAKPDVLHVELHDARLRCRRLDERLRTLKSLLSLYEAGKKQPPAPPAAPSPKGPPNLKLIG
jgi:hypothetical protein